MGLGSFAGGLATGWAAAHKMQADDADREERRKSLELERESRRLKNDEDRAAADSRRRMDEVAGILAQGGKTKTAAKVGDNTYSNVDDANAAAANAREFNDMETEAALDGQDRESPVTPMYPGGVPVSKTEAPYSRSQALGDARVAAGANLKAQEMLDARQKLWKAEGVSEAISAVRENGVEAGAKIFDTFGMQKAPDWLRSGTYNRDTDAITFADGRKPIVLWQEEEKAGLSVKDRAHNRIEEKKADASIAATQASTDTKLTNSALSIMRGLPGYGGTAARGSRAQGGEGGSKSGGGGAGKDDRKSFDEVANPEKASGTGDHAYVAFTQLTDPANNPGLAETEKGRAVARMLAGQYARGEIKAAPELGPDFRWSFVVKSGGGNSYILDRPEWGVDPTSLVGKDGKSLVDPKAVAEQETKALDGLKKSNPEFFSTVSNLVSDPASWKNLRDTYDLAKTGTTGMSKQDFSELQRHVMAGEVMRRRTAAPETKQAGFEKMDPAARESLDREVRAQRVFARLTPDAMVRRGAELGIPAAIEELRRRTEGAAFQPQNAGGVGYTAP